MGLLVEDQLLAELDEDRPLVRYPVDLSSATADAVQVALAVQRAHALTPVTVADPVITPATWPPVAGYRQLAERRTAAHPADTEVTVAVGIIFR
jgi:hypothetical protein